MTELQIRELMEKLDANKLSLPDFVWGVRQALAGRATSRMTESERAVHQALVARGMDSAAAREEALGGVSLEAARAQTPVTEYGVLEVIFEALPNDLMTDLYGIHGDMTRPHLYVTIDGECWRVRAERHRHHGGSSPLEELGE